jgi:hypothetical protein
MGTHVHLKTRFMNVAGVVKKEQYANGGLALVMFDVDGTPYGKLSVNLQQYGLKPAEGFVYVPDYSENAGLPAALQEAGLAYEVSRVAFGPYGTQAALMRVTF